MARDAIDWRNYVDPKGDFELGHYLYRVILDLMKESLDMGTMLSEDPAKRRAFKEQVKRSFRKKWQDVAEVLEFFDILVPCICREREFCKICGGSRYRLNQALSADKMQEIAVIMTPGQSDELRDKLMAGLDKAMDEYEIYKRNKAENE
jgi:hypothetical protein